MGRCLDIAAPVSMNKHVHGISLIHRTRWSVQLGTFTGRGIEAKAEFVIVKVRMQV